MGGATIWTIPYRYTIYIQNCSRLSLKSILKLTDPSGRLAQCCVWLSNLVVNVVHLAGVKHRVTDALSRLRIDGKNMTFLDDALFVFIVGNMQVTHGGKTLCTRLYVMQSFYGSGKD